MRAKTFGFETGVRARSLLCSREETGLSVGLEDLVGSSKTLTGTTSSQYRHLAFKDVLQAELLYAAGFRHPEQTPLRSPVSRSPQRLVPQVAHFWTPPFRGGPSCRRVQQSLGFEKSQRDFLGGWSAQGSGQVRTDRQNSESENMQKAVIRAIPLVRPGRYPGRRRDVASAGRAI